MPITQTDYYDINFGGTSDGSAEAPWKTLPASLAKDREYRFANGSVWTVSNNYYLNGLAGDLTIGSYVRAGSTAAQKLLKPAFKNMRNHASGSDTWVRGRLRAVAPGDYGYELKDDGVTPKYPQRKVFVADPTGNCHWTRRGMHGYIDGEFRGRVDIAGLYGGNYTLDAKYEWDQTYNESAASKSVAWGSVVFTGTSNDPFTYYPELWLLIDLDYVDTGSPQGCVFHIKAPEGNLLIEDLDFDGCYDTILLSQDGTQRMWPDAGKQIIIRGLTGRDNGQGPTLSRPGNWDKSGTLTTRGESTRGWQNVRIGSKEKPNKWVRMGRGATAIFGYLKNVRVEYNVTNGHCLAEGIACHYGSGYGDIGDRNAIVHYRCTSTGGKFGRYYKGLDGSTWYCDQDSDGWRWTECVAIHNDHVFQNNRRGGRTMWDKCIVIGEPGNTVPAAKTGGNHTLTNLHAEERLDFEDIICVDYASFIRDNYPPVGSGDANHPSVVPSAYVTRVVSLHRKNQDGSWVTQPYVFGQCRNETSGKYPELHLKDCDIGYHTQYAGDPNNGAAVAVGERAFASSSGCSKTVRDYILTSMTTLGFFDTLVEGYNYADLIPEGGFTLPVDPWYIPEPPQVTDPPTLVSVWPAEYWVNPTKGQTFWMCGTNFQSPDTALGRAGDVIRLNGTALEGGTTNHNENQIYGWVKKTLINTEGAQALAFTVYRAANAVAGEPEYETDPIYVSVGPTEITVPTRPVCPAIATMGEPALVYPDNSDEDADVTIEVSGTDIKVGDQITINGTPQAATTDLNVGNEIHLRLALSAADMATPGTWNIGIYRPSTTETSTGTVTFTVNDVADPVLPTPPYITAISPDNADEGTTGPLVVTITANYVEADQTVLVDGVEAAVFTITSPGNPGQATVEITTAQMANFGQLTINLLDPTDGISNDAVFDVNEVITVTPPPELISYGPASTTAGAPRTEVSMYCNNLVEGDYIALIDPGVATYPLESTIDAEDTTLIQASIDAVYLALVKTYRLRVVRELGVSETRAVAFVVAEKGDPPPPPPPAPSPQPDSGGNIIPKRKRRRMTGGHFGLRKR